jgi:hypothetical protein
LKALHSFTLDPLAAGEIKKIKKGKKSGFVSDAIVKYQKWKEWHYSVERQKTPEDMRFYYLDELMVKYNDKCIEVLELTKELSLIRRASKPKRSLISRLFSSNDE